MKVILLRMSDLLLYVGLVLVGGLMEMALQRGMRAIRRKREWAETVAGLRRMERDQESIPER